MRGLRQFSILLLLVVAFFAGSLVVQYCQFPFRGGLRPAFIELSFYLHDAPPPNAFLWYETDYKERGVKVNDLSERHGAYTFYCLRDRPEARLIDSSGNILHRWRKEYRDVWPTPRSDSPQKPGWVGCRLNPETGEVVAFYNGWPETLGERGLIKLNQNSELLFSYDGEVHHDIEMLPNGHMLVLTYRYRTLPGRFARGESCCQYRPTILDERLVELDENGESVKNISLIEVLSESAYAELLRQKRPIDPSFDLLHVNDVEVVGEPFANHHQGLEPGDWVFSARNVNALFTVSAESHDVIQVIRGGWRGQHDPDLLPSGRMLLFDNRGGTPERGWSRVLEFDPANHKVHWSYRGTPDRTFTSTKLGEQTRLPNGNTLINEGRRGRIFEVTPDNEIVWSYLYPTRKTIDGREHIGTFGFGVRSFQRAELNFLDGIPLSNRRDSGG
jgi:hypothetical protein